MAQQLVLMAATYIVKRVAFGLLSSDEKPTPYKPDDDDPRIVQIQTASYGEPIRRIWGSMRVGGNIIWVSPNANTWSWNPNITQPFLIQLAVGICEGPIDGLVRIWANRELIYDSRPDNSGPATKFDFGFKFYNGTEDQMPNNWIEGFEGVGNVPPHRGLCYIVLSNFDLQFFGYRIPSLEFEVIQNVNVTEEIFYPIDGMSASATDRDNIIFHPNDLHYTIVSDGSWRKYNTLSDDLILSAEHQSPKIPAHNGGFDIDERNIIHSVKDTGTFKSVLCRLDGDTFMETAASTFQMFYTPESWRIRVFRTDLHPYVVSTWGWNGSDRLLITHRDNYTFGAIDEIILPPPSGTKWSSFDLNEEEGIVWAISSSGSTISWIIKITVFHDGTYTYQGWELSNFISNANEVLYDPETDTLMIGSVTDDKIVFFDADSMTFDTENIITPTAGWEGIVDDVKSSWRRGVINGYITYAASQDTEYFNYIIYRIDIAEREVSKEWGVQRSPSECGAISGYGGSCFCSLTITMIIVCPDAGETLSDYAKRALVSSVPQETPLSSIVEDICALAGLDSSGDLDTSDLTDSVRGFIIPRQMTARAALEPLMDAYFIDAVDSSGVLKFVKRGSASSFTLEEADMSAHIAGEERPQMMISTRQQELELPSSLELMYMDYDADYAMGIQREIRLNSLSQEKLAFKLPIVLDKDEAKQICVKHLANIWMQRTSHLITTHREFAYLDPADVGTIIRGEATYTVRIEEVGFKGGMITLKLIEEDASVYESDAIGNEVLGDGEDDIEYAGHTLLLLIDCPLINATENSPGVQGVTLGYGTGWIGAAVYKNRDNVWHLQQPWVITTKDAFVAKSLNVLTNITDPWIWDEGNSINVLLLDATDSLSSDTKINVLNGSNIAILGDEIIQWRTATLENDGSYTLTGLLRGRRGTEWATGTHAIGEYFIPLDASNVEFKEISIDEQGAVYYYRPSSFGMDMLSGVVQTFVFAANNMKPLSPQHVAGTRDGSNDLTITWTRRTRMNGEWSDGGDVALGETSEVYEVDIYDDTTVVRTIEVTSESASYTAAQQTSDGLTPGDPVDLIIYQISSVIDRGFGTSATI